MSPEQARGANVDYRTDQFSLGLTLYEMASGRRAFRAETTPQILAAILEDEPEPLATANPRIPAPVRWTIEHCLAKDPRQRYDATGDLARELRTLRDRLPELTTAVEPASRREHSRWRIAALFAATVVVLLAAFAFGRAQRPNDVDYRLTPFATDAGFQGAPSWSPDGKTIAYVAPVDGILQVFTKNLTSSMRAQVTRARFHCSYPFWSPDGKRLYYTSLARQRDGLWSIAASGGVAELVMENAIRPALSPDGKTLAFYRNSEDSQEGDMALWLSTPPGATPVRYSRPPFGNQRSGDSTLQFSPDGTKLGTWFTPWAQGDVSAVGQLWVLPLSTGEQPHVAPALPVRVRGYAAAFTWLSDSRHIVAALPHPQPGVHLWMIDTLGDAPRQMTTTGGIENEPALSPDGNKLAVTFQLAD